MLILTYEPKASIAAGTFNHVPLYVVVERYADGAEESAHAKARQVVREGATEVFVARVVEKFWLEPTVRSEKLP